MYHKICKICGKEFDSKSKKAEVCNRIHTSVCCVCGKEFELKYPYTAKTCSPECRGIYRKESGIAKKAAAKAHQTLKRNSTCMSKLYVKKCAFCGKEFETHSPRRIYCYDKHYGKCPVCGKQVEIKEMYLGPQCCSEECRQKRIQSTNLQKYGSSCVFQTDEIKQKSKSTCLSKYGVEHYSSTDDFKSRYASTCMDKYGVASPLKDPEIKDKLIKTNLLRYGGNSPMCDSAVKDKMIQSNMSNNGGIGMASPAIRARIQATNINKYGSSVATKNTNVQSKIKETCLVRYGCKSWASSLSGVQSKIKDPKKAENFLSFRENPEGFIESNFDHKPSVSEICNLIGCTDTPVYEILIQNNVRDLATFKLSSLEIEVESFLKCNDIKFIKNCRSVITPYELDFYLPDYNYGIECNPTVTHNSSFVDPWGGSRKPPSYHKMKTDMCEEKGIFLFHIFGYEWKHKKEIVKSMILNMLKKSKFRFYARSTSLYDISYLECKNFLNENHLQGNTNASIRIALKNKDNEIVSVMCFSRLRPTMGQKDNDLQNEYELVRFCNKINTSVVGSASKLFKHFLNEFNPDKVVSFSDRSHTKGGLYKILGFEKVSISSPSYVWLDIADNIALHRVSCQKRNLINLFDDISENDIKNKTEKEIMEEHGFAQVFNSGVIRWEYDNLK